MSRLKIAINGRRLRATGDVLLWIELDLMLRDTRGGWNREPFRVDTGTEVTTFPAYDAKRLRLPIPQNPSPGAVHVQTGGPFRSGYLQFRIVGMDQTIYTVPCLFLGDPDAPPSGANRPRNLLQPYQLLDQLRFVFEKDTAVGSPYGEMVVETK